MHPIVQTNRLAVFKKKVALMRERGLIRLKKASAQHKESLAREFVSRSVLVPELKKIFGSELSAIILAGSVQHGVRRASIKRKGSDIDITVVIKPKFYRVSGIQVHDLGDSYTRLIALESFVAKEFGMEANIEVEQEKGFVYIESKLRRKPFQILFGEKWIRDSLGLAKLASFRKEKEQMRKSPKYDSNEKMWDTVGREKRFNP